LTIDPHDSADYALARCWICATLLVTKMLKLLVSKQVLLWSSFSSDIYRKT